MDSDRLIRAAELARDFIASILDEVIEIERGKNVLEQLTSAIAEAETADE